MFPITLRTAKLNMISLDVFVPKILDIITEETVLPLRQATVQENTLKGESFQQDYVAGWQVEQEKYLEKVEKGIYFDDIGFYIKVKDDVVFQVPYSQPILNKTLTDAQSVRDFISKQWFIANRSYAIGYILLSTAVLIATNVLLMTLGAAFFLWLTRKSTLFTIRTYKECLNMILNTLGIPTLLTTLALFMGIDIPLALQIHGFATVLIIVIVFYVTHYNDEYMKSKQDKS